MPCALAHSCAATCQPWRLPELPRPDAGTKHALHAPCAPPQAACSLPTAPPPRRLAAWSRPLGPSRAGTWRPPRCVHAWRACPLTSRLGCALNGTTCMSMHANSFRACARHAGSPLGRTANSPAPRPPLVLCCSTDTGRGPGGHPDCQGALHCLEAQPGLQVGGSACRHRQPLPGTLRGRRRIRACAAGCPAATPVVKALHQLLPMPLAVRCRALTPPQRRKLFDVLEKQAAILHEILLVRGCTP